MIVSLNTALEVSIVVISRFSRVSTQSARVRLLLRTENHRTFQLIPKHKYAFCYLLSEPKTRIAPRARRVVLTHQTQRQTAYCKENHRRRLRQRLRMRLASSSLIISLTQLHALVSGEQLLDATAHLWRLRRHAYLRRQQCHQAS